MKTNAAQERYDSASKEYQLQREAILARIQVEEAASNEFVDQANQMAGNDIQTG